MYSANNVLRRNWRLISFILAIIVVFWIIYAFRSVIFPFAIGLILAYLLLPVIRWTEKRLPRQGRLVKTKRVSLILLLFVVMLGLVGLLSFFVVSAVINAFSVLINNAPQYISWSLLRIQEWAEFLRQQLPVEFQYQIDQFILDAGTAVGNFIKDAFIMSVSFIPNFKLL